LGFEEIIMSDQIASVSIAEVEAGLRARLRGMPDDVSAIHDLGVLAFRDGRVKEAVHLLRQASALEPRNVALLRSLGQVLRESGEAAASADAFGKALEIDPRDAAVWNALGVALQESHQPARALEAYLRAVTLAPDMAEAADNAGILLLAEKDLDGAEAMFEQTLAIDPQFAEAHSNLGVLHRERLEYRKAIAHFRQAVELRPQSSSFAGGLGEVLSLVYDAEAESVLRRAVEMDPENSEQHFNFSLELLKHGKYAEGFREYEWRWKRGAGHNTPRGYSQPFWRGEDVRGKTVLVYHEQGLGDTLQMLRYVPMLVERGAKVVLEVQAELKTLVADGLGAGVTVLATGEALPEFDWHVGTMSLPVGFGTTMESVPAAVPLRDVRKRDGVRRVGLAWAGNVHHARDRERSLELAWLKPVLDVAGVEWVALQVGSAVTQMAEVDVPFDVPLLRDFSMTADVLETVDLVIAVDSAAAHLAATQGVPTWLLLPYVADWRWGEPGVVASVWYSSVRVFRQMGFPETTDQRGRWEAVVEAVAQELEKQGLGHRD
jgi:tetratricopeptide (TPR) repeat protein